jgi:hypothetical protein
MQRMVIREATLDAIGIEGCGYEIVGICRYGCRIFFRFVIGQAANQVACSSEK